MPHRRHRESLVDYSAKHKYRESQSVADYEAMRFAGWMGRYRYYIEQKAVTSIVESLPSGISIADCPCGTGRWWGVLSARAAHITAVDLSPEMLNSAADLANKRTLEVDICQADTEDIPLKDGAVDFGFCFALTKHLPNLAQYRVLSELSRIARLGVIASFGIFTHLSYEVWRHRKLEESYPVFPEELARMAKSANLQINAVRRCSTPLGVEHVVFFSKLT